MTVMQAIYIIILIDILIVLGTMLTILVSRKKKRWLPCVFVVGVCVMYFLWRQEITTALFLLLLKTTNQ
ncbi:hypothetical protein V202x_15110 [Gimesia aquarii]|uniref:Uncharacterized protein n=1 Tax=Gimesia aquarii TaxID=2527964 RepID=A0A517WSA7_9PLAN|nr:hypothetical protein V202x_15110 [Gimesia aquarii]